MSAHDTDVLIAGAGPVGLTLAVELTRQGVACRIIDKRAQRTDQSRAFAVWPRTLELLKLMGCVDRALSAGKRIDGAEINVGSRLLGGIDFEEIKELSTPYPFVLGVAQSETERVLDEHLQKLGGGIERETELTGFTGSGDTITATLRHADGSTETVHARYLVGCDGAHSTVRHGLGVTFSGKTEPFSFMLGDVTLDGEVPDKVAMYWHRNGLLAIFPFGGGHCRIIADLGLAEHTTGEATLQGLQAALDERGPGGFTVRNPTWLSLFRVNDRKVKDYRHGRVFLAGDAAHIHSPAGGQGMNTGMQDVINLAWKLRLVLTARASDALLDTYSPERSGVGEMVLRNAAAMTRFALIRNPLLQLLRNTAISLALKLRAVRRAVSATMTELTIAYPQSALSQGVSSLPLKPGMRAPDAGLPGGDRLFDALNREGFTVLTVGGTGTAPGHYGDLVKGVAAPATEEFARLYGEGIFVIRPDWYVGLVAASGDWPAVTQYLANWLR